MFFPFFISAAAALVSEILKHERCHVLSLGINVNKQWIHLNICTL